MYISDDLFGDQVILLSQNRFPSFKKITKMADYFNESFFRFGVNASNLINVFHFNKTAYYGFCNTNQNSFLRYKMRSICFLDDFKILDNN